MDIRRAIGAGLALQRQGRLTEAGLEYGRVLAADPLNFDALQLLGLVRFRSGDPAAGVVLFEQALAQHPDHVATLNNAGNAVRALGDLPRSIEFYRRAMQSSIAPIAMVLRNLGSALLETDSLDEAAERLYAALQIERADPELWTWISHLERTRNRPEQALYAVRQSLALDPTLPESYRALGSLAVAANRWLDALEAYAKGLELDPGMLIVRAQHYGVAQKLAHWAHWDRRVESLVDAAQCSPQAVDPMRLMLALDEPKLLRKCADRIAGYHSDRARPWARVLRPAKPAVRNRIRIGYLSGDIRNHPVAQLLAGVIERHDRSAFEVRTYALGPAAESRFRDRIACASEHFFVREVVNEAELATFLAAQELDILIDLMGHTEPGVPRTLAARPAVVQATWLGYPGTLGIGLCDYIIADSVVIPPGAEESYAETVVRMPDCMLPSDRTRVVNEPLTRREYGLPDDAVVLCCFAQVHKITPIIFDIWMAALRECPGAVLWLARPLDEAIANLAREALLRGVSPERIIYAAQTPEQADHLARYRVADVALDTFPYGSHSTATDVVWVGCPLVAIAGSSFQARVSASVLRSAGLAELVATDLQAYASKIIDLARDNSAREHLRERIAEARTASPLFEVGRFTAGLEDLYRKMHQRRHAGLPPGPLEA